MKLSKIALFASALTFSLTALTVQAASQGSGTIKFQGTVIDAPCGISSDAADQVVDFGELSMPNLKAGGVSPTKTFSIDLVNCDITAFKADGKKGTVTVSFIGGSVPAKPAMLGTTGGTGVAIVLTSQSGSAITFDGSASSPLALQDNSNQFTFGAVAKAADVSAVTAGQFNATANFSLAYQ